MLWSAIEDTETLKNFFEYVKKLTPEKLDEQKDNIKNIIKKYDEQSNEYYKTNSGAKSSSTFLVSRNRTKALWLNIYNKYSVNNEMPVEMLFYVIIGVVAKTLNATINVNGHEETPVLHLFWIQDSSSGKDRALDELIRIMEKYNAEAEKNNLPIIKYYELSGTETPEALLDSYETDSRGLPKLTVTVQDEITKEKTIIDATPTPGIFSRHDIIISRECSFLFRESRSDRQTKSEIMLQVLEGRTITKSLSSWRANNRQYSTYTHFDGSFVGVSRPINDMKAHLAYSGLQQRAMNYTRKLTSNERLSMIKKLSEISTLNKKTWENIKQQEGELVASLIEIAISLMKNGAPTVPQEVKTKAAEEINRNFSSMYSKIETYYAMSEIKDILSSFVGRFTHHVHVIAALEAISRASKKITINDYYVSLLMLNKSFQSLMSWFDEAIIENRELLQKKTRRLNILRDLLGRGEMKATDFYNMFSKKVGCSTVTAKRFVREMINQGVVETANVDTDSRIVLFKLKR